MEIYRQRLAVFAAFLLLFLGITLYRLVDIQLLNGEKYRRFSQMNTLREISIPAPRGRILDRQGRTLAENRPSFTLRLNPGQVKDPQRAIRTLADLLGTTPDEVREKISLHKGASLLSPVALAKDLDPNTVAKMRARMTRISVGAQPDEDLSGIDLAVHFERTYPFHEKVGHVLGYVREIGDKELKDWEAREPGRVEAGDDVGVAGAEKTFDLELRGYDGYRQTFV